MKTRHEASPRCRTSPGRSWERAGISSPISTASRSATLSATGWTTDAFAIDRLCGPARRDRCRCLARVLGCAEMADDNTVATRARLDRSYHVKSGPADRLRQVGRAAAHVVHRHEG